MQASVINQYKMQVKGSFEIHVQDFKHHDISVTSDLFDIAHFIRMLLFDHITDIRIRVGQKRWPNAG